jgi:uncharacterized SAM-binding protein YcdF (DUF218 family)
MQDSIAQLGPSSTGASVRPVTGIVRFLDAAVLAGALFSVVTLQSWRWMDLRFAGEAIAFILPWLWLISLVILQLLRFFPPRDIPPDSAWRLNRMLLVPSVLVALVLLLNTITFYHLKIALHGRMPWYAPMSLPVLLVLLVWLTCRPDYIISHRAAAIRALAAPWRTMRYRGYDIAFILPLLLVMGWIFHGMFLTNPPPPGTDADIAVVLGAGTAPGDTCGYTLRQRVLEGVRLFKHHRAQRLLLTGRAPRGKNNPYANEPQAMLKLALARGVPPHDLIVDYHGDNTRYSACDAAALIKARHWKQIIAVSSDYHLPRTALAFRQLGIHVWTVAAHKGIWPEVNPWAIVRELAGYPVYYFDRNYHRPGVIP